MIVVNKQKKDRNKHSKHNKQLFLQNVKLCKSYVNNNHDYKEVLWQLY